MQELLPKAEKVSVGTEDPANRKLLHSGRIKTGKFNRDEYNCINLTLYNQKPAPLLL